ncbi:MAG: DUF4097 family beta strand repeat-containing protein [Balneolaceae bacterium]|nr:DUF4097 family beta strand repeat-containing protein [Balneolaceae bacterium]
MKKTTSILSALFISLLFCGSAAAQDQIAIPLSNPGQPGKLRLGLVRGSISVSGYDGNEVIIRYNNESKKEEEQKVTEDGLRRITNNATGFEVTEDNNEVKINGITPMKEINFDLSVPRNFSLKLSLVNGEDITIENVNGEMEISHINGAVALVNVSGSASVNTVNGDITANFSRVSEGQPMAFTTLNGDIDVTLPDNAQLTAKMRSEWGDIYTDFDMDINRSGTNRNDNSDSGVFKVSINNWIYGDINGGGAEYLFKSMKGDIYIRKK